MKTTIMILFLALFTGCTTPINQNNEPTSLHVDNDLFVEGKLEVDDNAIFLNDVYFDSDVYFGGGVYYKGGTSLDEWVSLEINTDGEIVLSTKDFKAIPIDPQLFIESIIGLYRTSNS